MAGTRSQRAPLASPLTPGREHSARARRPTAKSHAQVVDQELEKRRKIREIEKQREDASYATVAGEHPQSRVAREARGKRAEASARVSDAYTRQEYGEEEARRRRQELRELLHEKDELDTSEIEEMQGEERESNPETIPQIHIRLNKKIEWRGTMQKIRLQDIDAAQLEEFVHSTINKKDPNWEIQRIMTHIKANHSRAKVMPMEISDFSIAEWQKVVDVIVDQSERWKYQLDVKLEVYCEVNKGKGKEKDGDIRPFLQKRSHIELSSDPPVPPSLSDDDEATPTPTSHPKRMKGSAHRSGKLIKGARERALVAQRDGHFEKALIDRWICIDEHLTNHKQDSEGFCFVDYSGKHYALDYGQQIKWAKAIEKAVKNGDTNVSNERPPTDLYNYVVKQGEVSLTSRRTAAYQERRENQADREEGKNFMQKFTEFQQMMMEQQMMRSMQENMEKEERRQRARRSPTPVN
ncbi:MAG: hypothetical protein Q9182_005517 [Xanthomendoza sp. 2 TL-2023]